MGLTKLLKSTSKSAVIVSKESIPHYEYYASKQPFETVSQVPLDTDSSIWLKALSAILANIMLGSGAGRVGKFKGAIKGLFAGLKASARLIGEQLVEDFFNGQISLGSQFANALIDKQKLFSIEWSAEYLWEVTLSHLAGKFKSFCPANTLIGDIGNLKTDSMTVGGYTFTYPSGCSPKTIQVTFNDDVYGTMARAISTWMVLISGDYQGGVRPLDTIDINLTYTCLTRGKSYGMRVENKVMPTGSVKVENTQSANVRNVVVEFIVLSQKIYAPSEITKQLNSAIEFANTTKYVQKIVKFWDKTL